MKYQKDGSSFEPSKQKLKENFGLFLSRKAIAFYQLVKYIQREIFVCTQTHVFAISYVPDKKHARKNDGKNDRTSKLLQGARV